MAPTVYVIVAAVQVFALFYWWTPSGVFWWQGEGALYGRDCFVAGILIWTLELTIVR